MSRWICVPGGESSRHSHSVWAGGALGWPGELTTYEKWNKSVLCLPYLLLAGLEQDGAPAATTELPVPQPEAAAGPRPVRHEADGEGRARGVGPAWRGPAQPAVLLGTLPSQYSLLIQGSTGPGQG